MNCIFCEQELESEDDKERGCHYSCWAAESGYNEMLAEDAEEDLLSEDV